MPSMCDCVRRFHTGTGAFIFALAFCCCGDLLFGFVSAITCKECKRWTSSIKYNVRRKTMTCVFRNACKVKERYCLIKCYLYRPVPQLFITWPSMQQVWGSILGLVKSDSVANGSPPLRRFFRSCVAQALSRGDGDRHSLHASAEYSEYNEDFERHVQFSTVHPHK